MPTVERDASWSRRILTFWFADLQPAQWFSKDDTVDAVIRARFAPVIETVAAMPDDELLIDPDTVLAAVIALDQFPRNLHRGRADAFAHDSQALHLAIAAIEAGLDQGRTPHQRLFLYLPFEHSEDAAMQKRSVAQIEALGDANLTRYAAAHKAIIDRFGRFPHRNAALGRISTAEELTFLNEPMSSF